MYYEYSERQNIIWERNRISNSALPSSTAILLQGGYSVLDLKDAYHVWQRIVQQHIFFKEENTSHKVN